MRPWKSESGEKKIVGFESLVEEWPHERSPCPAIGHRVHRPNAGSLRAGLDHGQIPKARSKFRVPFSQAAGGGRARERS